MAAEAGDPSLKPAKVKVHRMVLSPNCERAVIPGKPARSLPLKTIKLV